MRSRPWRQGRVVQGSGGVHGEVSAREGVVRGKVTGAAVHGEVEAALSMARSRAPFCRGGSVEARSRSRNRGGDKRNSGSHGREFGEGGGVDLQKNNLGGLMVGC